MAFLHIMKFIHYFKIPTADKKLLEQELEESKQISINDDDDLFEENFQQK